jgi:hypothetical protein
VEGAAITRDREDIIGKDAESRKTEQDHFNSVTAQLSKELQAQNNIQLSQDEQKTARGKDAADLKKQENESRRMFKEANDSLKILTVTPNVIATMDKTSDEWVTEWRYLRQNKLYDNDHVTAMNAKYNAQLQPTMITAKSLAQQMLTKVGKWPPTSGSIFEYIDRAASGQQQLNRDQFEQVRVFMRQLFNQFQKAGG